MTIIADQKPKIFVVDSMWVWDEKGVKKEWVRGILEKMKQCPQHTFMIFSKRPKCYDRFEYPENVWLGTSISRTADCRRVKELSALTAKNIKFVLVEPIHGEINFHFSRKDIDWIIVGAETGRRSGKVKAKPEWIDSIIKNARAERIPVFIKDNLNWPEEIMEYPIKKHQEEASPFLGRKINEKYKGTEDNQIGG